MTLTFVRALQGCLESSVADPPTQAIVVAAARSNVELKKNKIIIDIAAP